MMLLNMALVWLMMYFSICLMIIISTCSIIIVSREYFEIIFISRKKGLCWPSFWYYLHFDIELFVKAIPKVLFSHFKKINELEAKIMFVVLDTLLSMVMFSTVDYFMKSVSATPISLFVVSFVMSLLCMNDVIEDKDN